MKKNKRGITLIALVITIIVLLILAGVSISMITSQDGILNKAVNTKEKNQEAADEEKIRLAVLEAIANENYSIQNASDLQERIIKQGIKLEEDISGNKELGYTVKTNGKKYWISSNGEMKEISTIETLSLNIFNPDAVVLNKTVDSNGNIVTAETMISQTFEVKKGETAITLSYVTTSGTHQLQSFVVTFFDSSMNMLQQQSGTTHNIPENAKYFIINISEIFEPVLDKIMVQYGNEMTDFEAYLDEIAKKKNYYNYVTRSDNVSLNTDGLTVSNTLRSVSDYIYCYGQKVFSAGKGAEGVFCFYDINKKMISPYKVYSSTGTTNIEIPSNAYYVRTSLLKNYNKTFTFAFSEKSINYVKFGKSMASTELSNKITCKTTMSDILKSGEKIKFLGDSITQGVGGTNFAQDGEKIVDDWKVNTKGYCWANLLKKFIETNYTNDVSNFGTRGIRSFNITSWLDENNGYVSKEDKLLIIMIGTNNKWATTSDTLDDLKDDIQWIIDWCAENNKKLILISPPISTDKWDNEYSDGTPVKFHNKDIDNVYKEVCYRNNLEYVSMYQKMTDYCKIQELDINSIFSDGLHPNDKGYELMYNILIDELM